MSDTNLPQGTGDGEALSVEDGVDAIADVLKDPVTDLSEEDQGQQDASEEAEPEGDEPAEEETEDAQEEEPEQEEDGPQDDAGRFVADSGKVKLKDGSVISVQDLKRGYLSQASFTRGTQENARERETLTSQKAELEQHARTLQAERDFILRASQQFLPQPPDESLLDQRSTAYDPIRYMTEKAEYDKKVGALQQLQYTAQVEQTRTVQEQQRQQQQLREKEAQRLLEAMPELKKPGVYDKFWADAVDTMSEYGFSQEELDRTMDHRVYKIFRDLSAYRRARKTLPTVKQTMQSKPMLTGGKRMDPKAKTSREKQVRTEQLRKTGSFDAGVSALMDLDL
jgi:hypothetical protein